MNSRYVPLNLLKDKHANIRSGVAQWVARLTRNVEVVG